MKKYQKMSTCDPIELGNTRIWTNYAQNPPPNTVREGEKKAHNNIVYLPLLIWYVTN